MVQSFDEQLMLGRREWLILSDNNKPEPVGPDNKPLRDKPMKKNLREPSKIDNEFFDDSNIAGYMGQDEDVEQAQYNVMSLIEDKFGGLNKQIDRISKELETAIGKNKDDISELKGELCIPFLKDKCNTKTKQGCLKCADYYKELNQLPEDCYDPGLLNMHCQYTNTYTNSENEGAIISSSLALDLDNSDNSDNSDNIKCDDLEHFDCKAVIEDNYNSFQSNADKLCLWDEEGKQYNKPIIEDDSSSLNIKCRNLCNTYTDQNKCENKEGCFYSEGRCVEKICENRMNSTECGLNAGTPENGRCGVSNYGFSVESQNSGSDNPFFKNWRRWFGIYPKDDPEINTCVMKNLKSDGTFVKKGSPPQQYTQTERDYCLSDIDPTNADPDAHKPHQSSNVGYFISSQNAIDAANRGVTPNGNGPDYWHTFNYTSADTNPNILPYCRTSENIKKDTHNLEGDQSITGTVNCLSSTSVDESSELSSIDEYWFGSNANTDTDNPCNQNNLNRDYENSQSSESGGGESGGRTITQLYNDQSCELRESDYLTSLGSRDINFGKICEGNSSGCYYGSDAKYERSGEGSQIDKIFIAPSPAVCKSKDPDSILPCNILRKDSNECKKYDSQYAVGNCYRSKDYCYPDDCKNIDISKFTSAGEACKIGVDTKLKNKIPGLNSLCAANSDNTACKDEIRLNEINKTVKHIKEATPYYDTSFVLYIVFPVIIIPFMIYYLMQFQIGPSLIANINPQPSPRAINTLTFFLIVGYWGAFLYNFFENDPLYLFFANLGNLSDESICSSSPPDNLYGKMKQYFDCLDKINPLSHIEIHDMNDGDNPNLKKKYDYIISKAELSDSELKYEWRDCWRIHLDSLVWVLIGIAVIVCILVIISGIPGQVAARGAGFLLARGPVTDDHVKFALFFVAYGGFLVLWKSTSKQTIENGTENISDYKKVPDSIGKELGISNGVDISNITICESENLPYSADYNKYKNIYDLFYKDFIKDRENKYAYNWDTSWPNICFAVVFVVIGIIILLTIVNIFGDFLQNNWSVINLLDNNSDTVKYLIAIFMVAMWLISKQISDNLVPFKRSGFISFFKERTDINKLCSGDSISNELDITDLPNPPNKIGTYYDEDNSILPIPNDSDLGPRNGSCKIDNNNPNRGSFCDINDYSQDIEGNSAKEDITTTNSSKYCIPYSKWVDLVNAKITGDDSNIDNYKKFLKQQVLFNTHVKKITNDSGIKNQNLAFDYEEHHESRRGFWWWIIFCIFFTIILWGPFGYCLSSANQYLVGGPPDYVPFVIVGVILFVVTIYVWFYYDYTTDYIKKDFVEIITSSYNEVKGKSYEERGDCSACYAKKQNTNTGDYELIKINIPPGSRKSKSYECDKFNGCLVNELKDFNLDNEGDHICKGKGFTESDISKVKGFDTSNCDINVGGVSINIDDMYYYNDGLPGDYRDLDGVWKNDITDPETDKTKLIKNLDSKYRSFYISSSGDALIFFTPVISAIMYFIPITNKFSSYIALVIPYIASIGVLVLLLMYYTYDYNDTIDILNEKLKPEQAFVKDGQKVTKFRKINYPFFFFGKNMETDDNRSDCKISTTLDEN